MANLYLTVYMPEASLEQLDVSITNSSFSLTVPESIVPKPHGIKDLKIEFREDVVSSAATWRASTWKLGNHKNSFFFTIPKAHPHAFDRLQREPITKALKRRMEIDWKYDLGEESGVDDEDQDADEDEDESEKHAAGGIELSSANYAAVVGIEGPLLVRAAYPWCKVCRLRDSSSFFEKACKDERTQITGLRCAQLDLREVRNECLCMRWLSLLVSCCWRVMPVSGDMM